MITVSIISPKISMQAIQRAIDHHDFGCSFLQYVYARQEEIGGIVQECREKCDILLFSGEIGYEYAVHHIPDLSLPCDFVSYTESQLLSVLLNFKLEHPDIPLNRVFVDFLAPVNHYMNLAQYLPAEQMPYCVENTQYSYENILRRAQELYQSGKIDFILSRTTNNLEAYREMGVPFLHFLPTETMIANSIRAALEKCRLALNEASERLVVLVRILLSETMGQYDQEYQTICTHKVLAQFRQSSELSFSIEPFHGNFELRAENVTPRERLRLPRDLVAYLRQNIPVDFRLGAGMAESWKDSYALAERALGEAFRFGENDGFACSAGGNTLVGPLSSPVTLHYSYSNYKAVEYSQKTGIQERNLLRLLSLYELNPDMVLTSQGISEYLNITTRSCNRMFQLMLDEGLLTELPPEENRHRGRPFRRYQFQRDTLQSLFW